MGKGNSANSKNKGAFPPNYNKKLTAMKEKNAATEAELKAKYLQQIRDLNKKQGEN